MASGSADPRIRPPVEHVHDEIHHDEHRRINEDDAHDLVQEACLRALRHIHRFDVERPFFLYLHYMEPHAPYFHPPKHQLQFAGEYDGFDFIREGNPKPIGEMIYDDGPEYDITDRDIQHLIDLYDDEIRYFDDVFRSLLEELEARGLLEETMIVFASDHGEEFLEHGHISHCRGVWDTVTHVPLFFKIPGVDGRRIGAAVQNLDIVPTILDYLAIDGEEFGFEGRSLRPLIEGSPEADLPPVRSEVRFIVLGSESVLAEKVAFKHALIDGRYKLIKDFREQSYELYDLERDPGERENLASSRPELLQEMLAALSRTQDVEAESAAGDEDAALDPEEAERLRKLGYVDE